MEDLLFQTSATDPVTITGLELVVRSGRIGRQLYPGPLSGTNRSPSWR